MYRKKKTSKGLKKVFDYLNTNNIEYKLYETKYKLHPTEVAKKITSENESGDIIVIGGDGTFLFAVHQYMDILKETVFIGIHSGTLGFYMDYRDTEISEFLTDIIPGNLPVEEYPILEAQVGVQTFYAVNEIRI